MGGRVGKEALFVVEALILVGILDTRRVDLGDLVTKKVDLSRARARSSPPSSANDDSTARNSSNTDANGAVSIPPKRSSALRCTAVFSSD